MIYMMEREINAVANCKVGNDEVWRLRRTLGQQTIGNGVEHQQEKELFNIAHSKGGNTFEGLLAKYNIEMPIWNENNPISVKKWKGVSDLYASQVSGEVRAILGKNLRAGNVWETVELPRLKNNPKVTKIITIDPETNIETVIYQK